MFILTFFRYLQGYVYFEATGKYVERFLNLVARERIHIWESRKLGDTYTGYVLAGKYKKLRKHAKSTGVKIRVAKKRGAPFQRFRYRKRTGLLAGLLLFCAFVAIMSQYIWRIEINGNENIDEIVILQALESLNVSPGTATRTIDVRNVERRMLLLVPDLSWVALNIDGSAIDIEVSESVLPPEMVDPDAPCNIVAAHSGQIISYNIFNGQVLKELGETVTEGEVIVSGITQDERGQSLFRHSRATVIAQTTQTLEISVPLDQIEYVESGKIVNRRYLGIFGIELPIFLPLKIDSPYRVERENSNMHFGSLELPISLLREKYILMEEVPIRLTEDEAKTEALFELENLQKIRLGEAEILDKTIKATLSSNSFDLIATYICNQDIAVEQEIKVSGEAGSLNSEHSP